MADISKIKTLDGTTYNIKDAKAIHNVYDGLDSTSTSDALSANKGKELYDSLGPRYVADAISGTTAYEKIVTLNNQRVTVYDGLDSTSSTIALSANQGRNLYAALGARTAASSVAGETAFDKINTLGSKVVTVYDGLDSTSTSDALSANQGRGLYMALGARTAASSVVGETAFDKINTLNTNISAANGNISTINSKLINQTPVSIVGVSSKYTIRNAAYAKSEYLIRGNVCYVNINFQCVTPATASERVASGLPYCAINDNTVNAGHAFSWDNVADIGCAILVQNGSLYIKGGTAGSYYAITFSYPILLS